VTWQDPGLDTPDTGDVREDLVAVYKALAQGLMVAPSLLVLPSLADAASRDPRLEALLRDFVDSRRAPRARCCSGGSGGGSSSPWHRRRALDRRDRLAAVLPAGWSAGSRSMSAASSSSSSTGASLPYARRHPEGDTQGDTKATPKANTQATRKAAQ
jgi:hypothetical protein